MVLTLAAFSTNSAVVGSWVLLQLDDEEQTGGAVEGGTQNRHQKGSEADGGHAGSQ